MAAFETSRNHINWTMGSILAIYPTYSSQERTKAILFCHWDLSQHEKSMPPSLIGMDYLYSAIFKMAASEVKLRFRLLLRI